MEDESNANNAALKQYQAKAEFFLCACLQKNNGYNVAMTPGGLLYFNEWNNMQYVSSASFLMAIYSDYLLMEGAKLNCPDGQVQAIDLLKLAQSQVYNNGDVYEGEFHKRKCSGSGVYYYYMSGRYEGDWVDDKYDGYRVETWARGSRYRGQYRQGLRHGFGVYRFYTGDVYAGGWSNGQSHGCGVHTCEDGSWYVGEFKWGVKHGLGLV
ncbi:uncharacterized protein A4U43_C07F18930 [Asparagus officinalis]|uniref:cellulase n=1 Tax=Asparagus officinalis TaxID=4686 RepID=A0A5P1ED36_ASPOF|nr:uncharacterized protein A4U43_C07F18930 [Asparagus officinalis]